jgi:hypothetical protein
MSDEVTSPRLRNEQTTGDLKKAITDLSGWRRARPARSRLIFEPASVGGPAMSNRLLTANGTPASAPSCWPFASSPSIAAALASARSSVTAVNALSTRSCRLLRAGEYRRYS